MKGRVLGGLLAGSLGAAIFLFWLVLYTPVGLSLLWAFRPAGVEAEMVSGRLSGPATLLGLHLPNGARVEEMMWVGAPAELLSGTLHLERLYLRGVSLPSGEAREGTGTPGWPHLPLRLRIDDLQVEGLSREESIVLSRFSTRLNWHEGGLRLEDLSLRSPSLEVSGEVTLGGGDDHPLSGRLRWRWVGVEPALEGNTALAGSWVEPRFTTVLKGFVAGEGDFSLTPWAEVPTWRATLHLQDGEWPLSSALGSPLRLGLTARGRGVSGEGSFRLDSPQGRFRGRLQLTPQSLVLSEVAWRGTSPATTFEGQIRLGWSGETGMLEASWRRFTFADLRSEGGRLRVTGRAEDYRFELQAPLHYPDLPLGIWRLNGRGEATEVVLEHLDGGLLSGTVKGRGRLMLAEKDRPWRIHLTAEDLDPSSLVTAQGRLGMVVDAHGTLIPHPTLALRLRRLKGSLNGLPVEGSGQIRWAGAWSLPHLALHWGEARLRLHGETTGGGTLQAQLELPRLEQLYPAVTGAVSGEVGLLGLDSPHPQLQWRLSGKGLAWRGHTARQVYSEGRLGADIPWEAHLEASEARLDRLDLSTLRLTLSGMMADHRLTLAADAPPGRLRAELAGALVRDPLRWDGHVMDLSLQALGRDFRLQEPAGLMLSHQAQVVDTLCLKAQDSGLCLAARNDTELASVEFRLTHLPVGMFRPWLPTAFPLEGALHGHARLRLPRLEGTPSGLWKIEGENLQVQMEGLVKPLPVRLRLSGRLEGGRLQGEAHLAVPQWGRVQWVVPSLEVSPGSRTRGRWHAARLDVEIPELSRWLLLAPASLRASGPLHLQAQWDGPLLDPLVTLRGDGTAARISPELAGVELRELVLTAQGRLLSGLHFRLTGRTDAPFLVKGRVQPLPPGKIRFRLTGKRVETVRRPDLHLFTSPDLVVEMAPGQVALTGTLEVPQGEVMPQQAAPPTQVVAEPSDDVVIVNGKEDPGGDISPWATRLDVEVGLGEQVFFQGYGLSAFVSGRLRISRSPHGLPLATGELIVLRGEYEAYGQRLEIERGTLTYAATPLDNPAVDLLAVRRIEQVTVGLRLSGRLRNPQLTLFADPPMNETSTLSYLLFGRAPGEASGPEAELLVRIASSLGLARGYLITRALAQRLGIEETRIERNRLVLGRRLGERLYLTYAIGLGPEPNLWIVRYRLGRNWELKAEAGSGYAADLFFTVDR